ncbi:hypothetical protein E2C01_021870 [Portunus trituberculatus]|uniref:Uncharacterized protein n=1 Tax=Portunus trituberculatus TaxID=210409 RepID=A0A5B7E3X3_PORTR|nr:hypothetical protein [Portunus trituberculatus]
MFTVRCSVIGWKEKRVYVEYLVPGSSHRRRCSMPATPPLLGSPINSTWLHPGGLQHCANDTLSNEGYFSGSFSLNSKCTHGQPPGTTR